MMRPANALERPPCRPGVDQRLPTAIDLPAEVADVRLDHAAVTVEVVGPDVRQDPLLGQRPTAMAHEEAQQPELGRRQCQPLGAPSHITVERIELEVADA